MKITGENGLGNILKTILQICFIIGILILVGLPLVLKLFNLSMGASAILVYPNGIVLLLIVRKFIKLFDSLKLNNPFCENNVKILRKTGNIVFVGAMFWILDLLYELILARTFDIVFITIMLFLTILYVGVSIALYMLSELFKQATEYKNENELTI